MHGTRLVKSRQKATHILSFKASHRKGQHDVSPSHHVPHQCGCARKVLHHQHTKEAPACQRASICTLCRAAHAYITQMPCFYNSPSFNTTTKPENIPFTEAELGSKVLRMHPIQWHDQYNCHEKGMMHMDLHSLLTSLEVIGRVCTKERRPRWNLPRKLPPMARMARSDLVPNLWPESPRKLAPTRSIATYARSMGARTLHTISRIFVCMIGTERRKSISVPPTK
jgi:hypothetical protein